MNIRDIVRLNKRIEKGNAVFAGLSRKEKRLAIAQDAMAQLLLGQTSARQGVYVQLDGSADFDPYADTVDAKVACEAINQTSQCDVCAKGAILVSGLRCGLVKKAELYGDGDHLQPEYTSSLFAGAFPSTMFNLMEGIFEQDCLEFDLEDVGDDDVRLFGILENLIENEGDFKPTKDDPAVTERVLATRFKKAVMKAKTFR